ncbi:hypothetical protein [Variovorax sp. W2I14]|uniref:hypothetical protein n=1 Tax=Variovorax sp. W2I14 TaxID=3042290 RepID=UPI003D237CA6
MALDIGFLDAHGKHDCRLQFECDGYYWFLHPWFKALYQETGKYVDLYGDCHLHSGNGLLNLHSKISEALVAAQRQPSNWVVHTGTQLRPKVKELYSTVDRKRMVQVIEEFRALLEEAHNTNATVVCLGD